MISNFDNQSLASWGILGEDSEIATQGGNACNAALCSEELRVQQELTVAAGQND